MKLFMRVLTALLGMCALGVASAATLGMLIERFRKPDPPVYPDQITDLRSSCVGRDMEVAT